MVRCGLPPTLVVMEIIPRQVIRESTSKTGGGKGQLFLTPTTMFLYCGFMAQIGKVKTSTQWYLWSQNSPLALLFNLIHHASMGMGAKQIEVWVRGEGVMRCWRVYAGVNAIIRATHACNTQITFVVSSCSMFLPLTPPCVMWQKLRQMVVVVHVT